MSKTRHPILDLLQERVAKALSIFLGVWLAGAVCFWLIGQAYSINTAPVLEDGTADPINFGFLNCLYLAAMAVSTLGLADMGMLNRLPGDGRTVMYVFMIAYALISYLMVVYASAQIVSYVVEGALNRFLEKRRMERDLKNMSGHYVVCGLGATGHHIVQELVKVQQRVVGVDIHEAQVEQLKLDFPGELFLVGDATDDGVLTHAGVARADGLFSATPLDKDNIITVLTARQLNATMRVVARASNLANIGKLKQVGANATISPNHIGGMRMASEMLRPAVTTFLDTMLRSAGSTVRFENVVVKEGGKAANRPLGDLDIKKTLGLVVVATVNKAGAIAYNPDERTVVAAGDALVVIANPEQKAQLDKHLNAG